MRHKLCGIYNIWYITCKTDTKTIYFVLTRWLLWLVKYTSVFWIPSLNILDLATKHELLCGIQNSLKYRKTTIMAVYDMYHMFSQSLRLFRVNVFESYQNADFRRPPGQNFVIGISNRNSVNMNSKINFNGSQEEHSIIHSVIISPFCDRSSQKISIWRNGIYGLHFLHLCGHILSK